MTQGDAVPLFEAYEAACRESLALHKIWLSRQPDRDPVKKKRDRHRALAVAFMVNRYPPQYTFSASEMKMFPRSLVESVGEALSDFDDPMDFNG